MTTAETLAAVGGAALIGSDAAGFVGGTVHLQLEEAMALAAAGIAVVRRSVQVTQAADLAGLGAGTKTFTKSIGAALPANANIIGAQVKLTTPFTGGGAGDCTADIGSAGDVDAIVDGANIFAAAVDGQASTMPQGVAPNKHFVGAGAQLQVTVISTSDLNVFTAGDVTVDVLYSVLA